MLTETDEFVLAVFQTNSKTPVIMAYKDKQIKDIKSMCCIRKAVPGVDKMFNWCKIHITVMWHRQTSILKIKIIQSWLFFLGGQMFWHDNSNSEGFSYFFHNRLVVRSSFEKSLVKAVTSVTFMFALYLLKSSHI